MMIVKYSLTHRSDYFGPRKVIRLLKKLDNYKIVIEMLRSASNGSLKIMCKNCFASLHVH